MELATDSPLGFPTPICLRDGRKRCERDSQREESARREKRASLLTRNSGGFLSSSARTLNFAKLSLRLVQHSPLRSPNRPRRLRKRTLRFSAYSTSSGDS